MHLGLLQHWTRLVIDWIMAVWHTVRNWIQRSRGTVVTLDSGQRVVTGPELAQGGFSIVLAAWDDSRSSSRQQRSSNTVNARMSQTNRPHYALKRMHCPDAELLQACQQEASVHRLVRHAHLMPLLGTTVLNHDYYMLFPYAEASLRDRINERFFPQQQQQDGRTMGNTTPITPWPIVQALEWFHRLCLAVQCLHDHNITHRDIKPENVLLVSNNNNNNAPRPVLMDFGSAGPCLTDLSSRRTVLTLVEEAGQHTTLPYRPPELFEGGVRTHDDPLDYRAVDVWSLGCTLHAILYGASPLECDFVTGRTASQSPVRIVDCTHLRVLGPLPVPPPSVEGWYPSAVRTRLIQPMLEQRRDGRPTLSQVQSVVEELLLLEDGGRAILEQATAVLSDDWNGDFEDAPGGYRDGGGDYDDSDDGISLTSRAV